MIQIQSNKIALLILISLSSFICFAQDNFFKLSAQYRTRTELRNGYRTLINDSSKTAFFTGQRTRLLLEYKKDKIQFYTSIQDARTWGDEEQKKDIAGLQVNELWMNLKLNKDFSLKMGRQELVYDDHRLLGNLDWANLTISHDAILLKYINNKNKINWHVGGAFNQVGEPVFGTNYTLKNYKVLGFSWINKVFNKGHTISTIAIINGMNSSDVKNTKLKATYTVGPLYNYNFNGWKGIIGAYYQGGKTESNLNQNAFMINAYVEKDIKQLAIGLGTDYLSGNKDNTIATSNNSFSTLYATNHKFYGYMDYFLNIPTDTKQRGLIDLYTHIGYKASKTFLTSLDIHYISLAQENYLGANKIKKPLGTEVDLLIDYKPSSIIQLQFGYSILFATNNMEYIKGGNAEELNSWAYLMLKISPTLLHNEQIK